MKSSRKGKDMKVNMPGACSQADQSIAGRVRATGRALTVEELAELLNVSTKGLYSKVRTGRMPALKLGSMIRFDPHVTARWLEDQAA